MCSSHMTVVITVCLFDCLEDNLQSLSVHFDCRSVPPKTGTTYLSSEGSFRIYLKVINKRLL